MVFTYFFPPSFPLTQQHLVIFNCVLFLLAHFQVGKELFKSIIFYVHTFGVLMALDNPVTLLLCPGEILSSDLLLLSDALA